MGDVNACTATYEKAAGIGTANEHSVSVTANLGFSFGGSLPFAPIVEAKIKGSVESETTRSTGQSVETTYAMDVVANLDDFKVYYTSLKWDAMAVPCAPQVRSPGTCSRSTCRTIIELVPRPTRSQSSMRTGT